MRDALSLRTVFGYQKQLDAKRKNRIRFCQRLSVNQYKILVVLLETWKGQFEQGCTTANAELFKKVIAAIPETAMRFRGLMMAEADFIFCFSDKDYETVREVIGKLSLLEEAGYYSPGKTFKIPDMKQHMAEA